MFKRFAVIGFSYFSLLVVLLSLLKVNVANAETNENLLQSEINKHFSHQSILHQKSLVIDFSELLLLFEDGEELDELDSEQETTSGLSIPFFEFQQEIFLLKKQGSVIQELQVLCSSAIQITYPRLHIQHCLYRI